MNIISIFDYVFLTYGLLLLILYFCGIFLAHMGIVKSRKKSVFLTSRDIITASDLPHITLVAPAYNEGRTIIDNVLSLLLLKYPYYDLIIVNDGSKDDSLEKLVNQFELEPIEYSSDHWPLSTAEVKNVYKSQNSRYQNLTVVDKANGGRSDALNAGLNISRTELILFTDADCIIEETALVRMVTPFLEEENEEIVACGGGIGLANGSIIQEGVLKRLKLPPTFLGTVQVVEYFRAFLLGRMAWGQVNGLLLVSGAFGMFPRRRMVEVGGFDTTTIGEDLELCVRLRRHMNRLKVPHRMVYLPLTLCWTEAPSTYSIFVKQRDRWARGLWQTLRKHRAVILNLRYRKLGLLLLPYWVIFEFGAPLIEILGLIHLVYLGYMGYMDMESALYLFLLVYLLGCLFSTAAIFMYVNNFSNYKSVGQISRLLIAAFLEPFFFHPVLVFASIQGYFKSWFGIDTGWGEMTRKGFAKSSET